VVVGEIVSGPIRYPGCMWVTENSKQTRGGVRVVENTPFSQITQTMDWHHSMVFAAVST